MTIRNLVSDRTESKTKYIYALHDMLNIDSNK